MREVVCDTSPLLYLHQVGLLDLLSGLYGTVTVPVDVMHELDQGRAQGCDVPDIRSFNWMCVVLSPPTLPTFPSHLGAGERAVIAYSLSLAGPLAVMDDELARRFARESGVAVTGTLGVLLKAKEAGLLSRVTPVVDELARLGFHLSRSTRDAVLKLANECE